MLHINDIDLLDEIYQSEDSIVFRGYEKNINQNVIVKILKEDFPAMGLVAQFNGEYDITNKYDLQGIRKVLQKRKVQNKHVLVLEYIDGVTIKEYIKDKHIDVTTFLKLAIHFAEVLAEIHQAGIIHKDINPKNVMVTTDNKIKIIDFGVATSVKRELQSHSNLHVLEGTLAYMSPEQTGRMNRSVDYRSDLYSVGVTFYEMLTGELPFYSEDAMELVHSHIAKYAKPVYEVRKDVPKALSDIVAKLMEKNAENRYQSAYGLQMDLENCFKQWQTKRAITLEKLATQDVYNTFHIPEKLYGRRQEVQSLLNTFETVTGGVLRLTLIGGYSGIGKTALINELSKPITAQKGYFIMGKYDQFQRDTPYSAIIQALKDFVSQVLLEKEEQIKQWKEKILQELGNNAQVIIDVVPSLELIIGKQPLVTELPPLENQNRFNYLFQKFIKAISHAEHPLVLFIDDWQWADLPSLDFLKLLIEGYANLTLHVIGAYRDNEVNVSHPFITLIESLKETQGIKIEQMFLKPLSLQDVNLLIADTLKTVPKQCEDLTQVIYQKTQGNPFFVNQFFSTLYEESLINYDLSKQLWYWDIATIAEKNITNNVVELMTSKIQKLPAATCKELQYAACIGNMFDLKTLSFIVGKNQKATLNTLWKAAEEGLIRPKNDNYQIVEEHTEDAQVYFSFLHDRVQQAAYSMLNQGEGEAISLQIGRLAYQNNDDRYRQEWICDIANYYNKGKDLVKDKAERELIAKINWQAGLKAKRANAYGSASNFLSTALEFTDNKTSDAKSDDQISTYLLYKEAAEAAYLARKTDEATELYKLSLQNTRTDLEKIEVIASQVRQFQTEGKFDEAYEAELYALSLVGINIPADQNETLPHFQAELGRVQVLLSNKTMDDLLNGEPMRNAEMQLATQILDMIFVTCFISGRRITLAWSIAKMANLSIEYGHTMYSAQGYVTYGLLCCSLLNQPHTGYQFGKLGIDLSDKYNNLVVRSKTYHTFATCVTHWTHDPKESLYYFAQAHKFGLEGGEFEYGTFAFFGKMHESLRVSLPLASVAEEAINGIPMMQRFNPAAANWVYAPAVIQPIKNFLGQTKSFDSFDTDDFTEEAFLETYKNFPLALCWLYTAKITNLYIFGYDVKGVELVVHLDLITEFHGGIITIPLSYCYGVLLLIANWKTYDEEKRKTVASQIEDLLAKVRTFAENCPSHYLPKLQLVAAEYKAYIEEKTWEAIELYDKAIEMAQQAEDSQFEGIIAERAGKLFLYHKKNDLAKVYFQKSLYAFKMWGALGKVQQLEETYPTMFPQRSSIVTQTHNKSTNSPKTHRNQTHIRTMNKSITQTGGVSSLDFGSIMKASQAISGEIRTEHLLSKMIDILIENAGAERGVLLQENERQQLVINAEGYADSTEIELMQAIPIEKADLPLSIIRYVERTKETLILDDAGKDRRFVQDTYVIAQKSKSIYCSPITIHGKVKAILYLENNLSPHVFDEQNAQILSILSGQIAISLENSSLYTNLEQKVEERTKELNAKHQELSEKNARITDSVRYALNIQTAILPLESEMERLFPKHFVIYKPKDIVSGDFYWIAEVEKYKFLAVVDCTGHGVPGAFMSMLGNSLLNQIVSSNHIISPADILMHLHEGISKVLKQDETDNKDGMDVCLCRFQTLETHQTQVTFAGAKRPLYYMVNGELQEIQGNRYSIGGILRNLQRIYQNNEVILPTNSVVYLSTDGFTDQANKLRDRFSMLRLRAFIAQNGNLAIEQQKEILLSDWEYFRQDTEQRDDVTLIGVVV